MSDKNIAHPEPTAVLLTAAKFFRLMFKAGVPFSAFTLPMQDKAKRKNLAAFIQAGCPDLSVNDSFYPHTTTLQMSLASSILEDDFITPNQVMETRGLRYSDSSITRLLAKIPAEGELRRLKENNYALLPGPPEPMSLLDIRNLHPELFFSRAGGWYSKKKEKFARDDMVHPSWIAIRKEPFPDSLNRDWSTQKGLLAEIEFVPNMGEFAWFVTTYFAVRQIRLFESVYVRTASANSDGIHVHVGHFDGDGLCVRNDWDVRSSSYLGVASAQKFQ